MQTAQEDFAATYSNLAYEDIAALHAELDALTEPARAALTSEIRRRGLQAEELVKLHANEVRHEARFDRRENARRKKLAWGELGLNDLKGWIIALLLLLAYELVRYLAQHHH